MRFWWIQVTLESTYNWSQTFILQHIHRTLFFSLCTTGSRCKSGVNFDTCSREHLFHASGCTLGTLRWYLWPPLPTRANQVTISSIPKDPHSCRFHFQLDPIMCPFLCCPQCHCLYPNGPGNNPKSKDNSALVHCTYQQTITSPVCNTNLWKRHRINGDEFVLEPIKKYLHQDLKHWLGRLLSHKGIE